MLVAMIIEDDAFRVALNFMSKLLDFDYRQLCPDAYL